MPIIFFVSFLLIHKSAYQKKSIGIPNIEFEVIWRSFGLGSNTGTKKVIFAYCFEGSIRPQRVWVPRHKRTTYKLIFGVVIVF